MTPSYEGIVVLGLADEMLGYELCSLVVPSPGVEQTQVEAALRRHCEQSQPAAMRPLR